MAAETGMTQNAVSRLENPGYGKATLSTLKRLAEAFDVALLVQFVPFSRAVDWVSGTPHIDQGVTTDLLNLPSFETEQKEGAFEERDDNYAGAPSEPLQVIEGGGTNAKPEASGEEKPMDSDVVAGNYERKPPASEEIGKCSQYQVTGGGR